MSESLRLVHDGIHIALVPLSGLIVLGAFSPAVESVVERFDFFTHLVLLGLAVHSLHVRLQLRKVHACAPASAASSQ